MRKEGNITDVFRFVGAFLIVWYHNQYNNMVATLNPALLTSILTYLSFFLNWTLPFFYVTTARFAFMSNSRTDLPDSQKLARIKHLVLLLLAYMLIYEVERQILSTIRAKIGGYIYQITPFDIFMYGTDWPAIIKRVLNIILTVHWSPMYFLNHVIIIYACAFILCYLYSRLAERYRQAFVATLCGVTLWALIFPPSVFAAMQKHLLGISGWMTIALLAFSYQAVTGQQRLIIGFDRANGGTIAAVVVTTILVAGFISTKYTQMFYYHPVWVLIILILGDVFPASRGRVVVKLAEWGRKYSFGIFVFHFPPQEWFGYFVPMLWTKFGFAHPSIALLIIINLLSFLTAFGITALLYRYCPRLVKIG